MVEHCQHEPRRRQPWRTSATDACKQPDILTRPRQPRSAAGALSRVRPGTTCRRSPPGAVVASWPASPIERTKDRPNCRRSSTASTPRSCPRHGNPDRQPVRCLAFDLAHLPAIATRHRSTLAPSSLRGRLHRSRGRKPDRTAGDRALPARTTPAATLAHVCNRCLQAPREPAHATATPIGSRYAVSPRPGPLAGDRHQAPSSLRGRLHQSRGRRTDRTADGRALPARATPAATADCPHPESLTRPRHDRSAAGTLSRLRPGPLAGDRHPAPLDAGAVVASWPASPIERTKARPNCRWSSVASTGHASGNRGLLAPREPDQATARPIGSRYAVSPSTWHHLPAIATRHRSTLAPSSPRGRLHRSRERRPCRTAGDRALPAPREPDHATATPIGSRYAVSPSTWPTCRRSPPGTARHWRRRRFLAGFTDRENEGPTELPVIDHCQRPDTPTTAHGNPDRQPVRCSRSPCHHLPAIATKHRSTLALSSLRGRLHRSRERRPDRTADGRALPARTTPAATLAHVCNRCLQAPRDPAHATATPIGSRCAVSRSPWPTCRRSPPGTARPWRRRRFVAGFTDRENEGPTELPMVERCQHGPRQRQPRIARTPRA
jgi:hypothetical protein